MNSASHHRLATRAGSALGVIALAFVLTGCPPNWPPPTHVVDQQNVGSYSFTLRNDNYKCNGAVTYYDVAQSFTAGRTGQMDQVSLVAQPFAAAKALTVSIQTVASDGTPSGTQLGAGSYTGPGSADLTTLIDIPLASRARVVAGQQYAIVLSTPVTTDCPATTVYGWNLRGDSNTYAGGRAWQRGTTLGPNWGDGGLGSNDLFFETWVIPG